MSGPTPAHDAGRSGPGWVGRASVPEQVPPTDPYWPPVEPAGYPPTGYVLVPARVAPRRRRVGLFAAIALSALFVACCAGGAMLSYIHKGVSRVAPSHLAAPVPAPTPTRTTKATRTTPSAPAGAAHGHAPVNDGKFQFVVGGFSCGHDTVHQGVVSKAAQGQFCLLSLTVRNIGSRSQAFADSFQKAFGPGGAEYGPDTTAGIIANANGTNVWTVINPGNQVTGMIVFDIPKDAAIATIELHDSLLSHGVSIAVG